MQYRTNPKNGDSLSALGYGCMRFPKDEKETEKQILSAIEQGVNYFDTAYIYPGNEATLGRILAKNNCREKIKIATKLPHYMVRKREDIDKLFNTQLERLQTGYIDYYLMHMLSNLGQWEQICRFGIIDWIEKKKASGEIINIGFSYHGGQKEFTKIIDAYDWDFCMIQYNYLDENNQAGKNGLVYASEKGIPVMIMEPLRGGKLAVGLPEESLTALKQANPSRTPAEWGLRWVWNHPEAITVLSGMSTQEMLDENVRIASTAEAGSLTQADLNAIEAARTGILGKKGIPCTGCNYCMPCPAGVDIPLCFTCYNNLQMDKKITTWFNYISYAGEKNASKCTKCGKCEKHCPQSIEIRKELQTIKKEMERFPYKLVKFVTGKIMKME